MWTMPVEAQVSQATRAVGVVGQDLVEDGIGDLIADLVGMSLGNGLGSKQMMLCHKIFLHSVALWIFFYSFLHRLQALRK